MSHHGREGTDTFEGIKDTHGAYHQVDGRDHPRIPFEDVQEGYEVIFKERDPGLNGTWSRGVVGCPTPSGFRFSKKEPNDWSLDREDGPIYLISRKAPAPPAHDPVEAPSHYLSHPEGIPFELVAGPFPGHLHSALKYIWRCGLKVPDGSDAHTAAIEDLGKAAKYIEFEIKRQKREQERKGKTP